MRCRITYGTKNKYYIETHDLYVKKSRGREQLEGEHAQVRIAAGSKIQVSVFALFYKVGSTERFPARKGLIQREKKREKLEQKYHLIRRSLKKEISTAPSLSEKWKIHGKLQSSPRNSAPTRLHRRCFSTGRRHRDWDSISVKPYINEKLCR